MNFSKHISKMEDNIQWNWQKKHACLLFGGGRSNISHWLAVGIEPCKGRIKNLWGSPSKLFPLSLSSNLEISSQPVRNTRIAPLPSFRHIYSIVASTWNIIGIKWHRHTIKRIPQHEKKEEGKQYCYLTKNSWSKLQWMYTATSVIKTVRNSNSSNKGYCYWMHDSLQEKNQVEDCWNTDLGSLANVKY